MKPLRYQGRFAIKVVQIKDLELETSPVKLYTKGEKNKLDSPYIRNVRVIWLKHKEETEVFPCFYGIYPPDEETADRESKK